MYGPKPGEWKDFATGERRSNLLDLLHRVRGREFLSTCEEAANLLSFPENSHDDGNVRKTDVMGMEADSETPKHGNFKDLQCRKIPDFLKLLGVSGWR
ncbi:MAG: hypothetical protein LBK24_01295 [Puniceicoccales bacterium]|nr:hypothetical protein [Puniceicoccales bacterium]